MAKIIKQKLRDENVVAEVVLTKEETKELGGEMEDVTLFTESKAKVPARISLRGKHEATKYFLIPKVLRKDLNTLGSVSCQRLHRDGKDIFVYVVDSDTSRKSYVSH
jgi:hypothetical protein